MNRTFVLGSLLWLFCAAISRADPLVSLPAGDISCSVLVTPDTTGSPSGPAAKGPTSPIRSVQITQTGNLRRIEMTDAGGQTREAWVMVDSGLMLMEITNGPTTTIDELPRGTSAREALYPLLLDLDSASTAWITPKTLTGKASHNGVEALHYQYKTAIYRANVDLVQVLYQAWIDPKNLLPIAFDDGFNTYELTFAKEPPVERLVLPERFKSELQHYLNANAQLMHL